MVGWILSILKWILGLVLKSPSQEVVQATKASAAETELKNEVTTDEKIQKATIAVVSVTQSISTDSKLRTYESTDPNNRDNQ